MLFRSVRDALMPVLALAALFQPAAAAVFVLDGVLIGAGDAVYLAWAGLGCTGVFVGGLALLHAAVPHGGTSTLVGLWLVIGVFTLARWVALAARSRSDAWLRTGPAT